FRTLQSTLRSPVRCPVVRLSAAGEGGSKVIAEEPQAVFKEKTKKHETFLKKQQNQWVEVR
ncbi:hypothetical protein, partial [Thalassobius sp. Cn5-15]|uniref:hypothetical protein n=1 Tax=Thalassobius sp. Cn5-15 TaxID=2917763 RepID=UPI001EF37D8C